MSLLWIVQDNLFREDGHVRLLSALDRLGALYVLVCLLPFTDDWYLTPNRTKPWDAKTHRPAFVLGSYKLARTARERGFKPGAFMEGLAYTEWEWRKELLLNGDAWVGKINDLPRFRHPVFVRPVHDSKAFAGTVLDGSRLEVWAEIHKAGGPQDFVNGETEIIVSPVREIFEETRCWIVKGQVVTASVYKRGGKPFFSEDVEAAAIKFARVCALKWSPSDAYVLDVALTPDGYKIVEANCLNAAGFYAADMQKLVAAIEAAFGEE